MSERQKKRLAQKEASRLKRRMIEKVLLNSKTSNSAFNLNYLVDGWLELESDPSTFSLLIEDFGCFGAQVDEVYDLEQKFDGPVFGFIFLFKWLNQQHDRPRNQKSISNNPSNSDDRDQPIEERSWSFVEDEDIISEMFFAKQMISNSCATHALISILLNCDYDELNIGPILTRLKEHTKVMNPENKGYAIGNLPELAKAHNSHASYSSLYSRNRLKSHSSAVMISGNQRTNLQQQNQHEAYHFVSYVPINNRLYELDGLKSFPIDHGPIGPKEDWTEKFRSVIKQRLLLNRTGEDATISNDIRYNLMAVVPDKRVCLRAQQKRLKFHQINIQKNVERLTGKFSNPLTLELDIPNPPYSPLSNGTLTASEVGSVFNSPRKLDDCLLSDDGDDNKIEKLYFIKFDNEIDSNASKDDNNEPAHKNCIIEFETTNVLPLDLKANVASFTEDKSDRTKDNKTENTNGEEKPDEILENTNEESSGLILGHDKKEGKDQILARQTNGTDSMKPENRINTVQAHGNIKYNLSSKPPFDFNIIDELQNIHVSKSAIRDLKSLSHRLTKEMEKLDISLKEETDKRRKFKIDNSRRTHNYEPFIMTFLSMLAKHGNLADLIEKDLGIFLEEAQNVQQTTDSISETKKPTTPCNNRQPETNGSPSNKTKVTVTTKPKYKYVSTGRPVGRPRKYPLVASTIKTTNTSK